MKRIELTPLEITRMLLLAPLRGAFGARGFLRSTRRVQEFLDQEAREINARAEQGSRRR